MAIVASGSSVTIGIYGDQVVTLNTSPGTEGQILLNGSPGAIGTAIGPAALVNKTVGPFGVSGSLTITSKSGAITYTLSQSVLAGPIILAQSAVPVILAPTGTWNDTTGGLTLGTALPYTPSGTVRIYLTNSGITTAGMYYATFSSTTVCQVYTDSAATTKPTTTAGAYTAATGADVTLATITVPGGAMGANGTLVVTSLFSYPSNANNKILRNRFDTTAVWGNTATTTAAYNHQLVLRNRNSQSSQVAHTTGASAFGSATSAVLTSAVDTSVDKPMLLQGQLATATDYIILESYNIQIQPGL